MRPRFHPRTINGPFDDPGVFVPFIYENRALMFDAGDFQSLSPRDLLKVTHVFVTHTHMDHFIGFDKLVRMLLGREKNLFLFGPAGFLDHVRGKLSGYSWNLVENYAYKFTLVAREVREDGLFTQEFPCRNRFISPAGPVRAPFSDVLHVEPDFFVKAAILDHGIPCLAFSLEERFHVNIRKEGLDRLGLEVGPWLKSFKDALFSGRAPDSEFQVPAAGGRRAPTFKLGELAERIALITPGQKITYVTDAAYSPANVRKITALAKDSDHLFIEASFAEAESSIAAEKLHLTARQAGTLAGKAGVKNFTIFHFSPRYAGQEGLLEEEARRAFDETRIEGLSRTKSSTLPCP